jgi:hypothetical protein
MTQLVEQAQSPDFKMQYYKKEKKWKGLSSIKWKNLSHIPTSHHSHFE